MDKYSHTDRNSVFELTAEISWRLSADLWAKQSFSFTFLRGTVYFPHREPTFTYCQLEWRVCAGLYSAPASVCVVGAVFWPMSDCYHCCVKQIRELGWFWRITLDFWIALRARCGFECLWMNELTLRFCFVSLFFFWKIFDSQAPYTTTQSYLYSTFVRNLAQLSLKMSQIWSSCVSDQTVSLYFHTLGSHRD